MLRRSPPVPTGAPVPATFHVVPSWKRICLPSAETETCRADFIKSSASLFSRENFLRRNPGVLGIISAIKTEPSGPLRVNRYDLAGIGRGIILLSIPLKSILTSAVSFFSALSGLVAFAFLSSAFFSLSWPVFSGLSFTYFSS